MPALNDFHTRVARVINRGTRYDTDIPLYVVDAVLTLESLHNWRHMWRESFQQTLVAADKQIIFTGVPKSVRYLRFAVPSNSSSQLAGKVAYAKKIQPEDVTGARTYSRLDKVGYWFTNPTTLQFDGAFSTNVLYDIGWYLRSTVNDSLPWFTVMPGLLLAQTLVEMHPLLKDDKVFMRNAKLVEMKLSSVTESDLIHQFDGDDQQMDPFFDTVQEDQFHQDGGLP